MSRKRRMFEIEIPEDGRDEIFPAGKPAGDARRGPMATAISETVDSTRDRVRLETEIRAENDRLAQEHVRLKRAGLITDLIPLDAIDSQKLVRDRATGPDSELEELVASIREIGLSNPIRVEPAGRGRYELIQGWRRLSAYRHLLEETGDAEVWGRIPAGIVAQGDELDRLYRRMVDENMVRKDISFAEMAQLALTYARDPATPENDPDKAVALLFKSAGYQKRSYIRSFIPLIEHLGQTLRHAPAIPRALGLALSQRLAEAPDIAGAIRTDLMERDGRSEKEELDVLRRHAGQGTDGAAKDRQSAERPETLRQGKARTTFQIVRPRGNAKCTAANGRLEIRLACDFSAIDRRKLERAVAQLLKEIE